MEKTLSKSNSIVSLQDIIKIAIAKNASDILFSTGYPPYLKIVGEWIRFTDRPYYRKDIDNIIDEILSSSSGGESIKRYISRVHQVDFSFQVGDENNGIRFRANIFETLKGLSIALRSIPIKIPDMSTLGLPPVAKDLVDARKGLVLVTGATGQGKSTTLAAIINEINKKYNKNIITIEDPIEYIFPVKKSIIHQREVMSSVTDFSYGVKAALREAPDVIFVGEMRDLETMANTLTAAETGHLVFATLHSNSAPETIDRIVDVFPAHKREQIRLQFASVLNTVICQQLVPSADKSRLVLATEVMRGTPAIRTLIREGKTNQIKNEIQKGKREKMHTMEQSLKELASKGIITETSAHEYAFDREFYNQLR